MQPRKANKEEVRSTEAREYATRAERHAFSLEIDAEIAKVQGDEPARRGRRSDAVTARAEADAANKAAGRSVADINNQRREVLDERLRGIEQNFLTTELRVEIMTAAKFEDSDTSSVDGQTLEQRREALERHEAEWKVVTTHLDSLGEPEQPGVTHEEPESPS